MELLLDRFLNFQPQFPIGWVPPTHTYKSVRYYLAYEDRPANNFDGNTRCFSQPLRFHEKFLSGSQTVAIRLFHGNSRVLHQNNAAFHCPVCAKGFPDLKTQKKRIYGSKCEHADLGEQPTTVIEIPANINVANSHQSFALIVISILWQKFSYATFYLEGKVKENIEQRWKPNVRKNIRQLYSHRWKKKPKNFGKTCTAEVSVPKQCQRRTKKHYKSPEKERKSKRAPMVTNYGLGTQCCNVYEKLPIETPNTLALGRSFNSVCVCFSKMILQNCLQ